MNAQARCFSCARNACCQVKHRDLFSTHFAAANAATGYGFGRRITARAANRELDCTGRRLGLREQRLVERGEESHRSADRSKTLEAQSGDTPPSDTTHTATGASLHVAVLG